MLGSPVARRFVQRRAKFFSRMLRTLGPLLASVGMIGLSLAIVVAGPARPASALDARDYAKIGKTLSAGTKVGAAAACTTGIGCGVIAAVSVGMLAYETSDLWLPVVKGLFGGAFSDSSPTPVAQCPGISPSARVSDNGLGVTFDMLIPGYCGGGYLKWSNGVFVCRSLITGAVAAAQVSLVQFGGYTSYGPATVPYSATLDRCGSGTQLVAASGSLSFSNDVMATFSIGEAVSPENLSTVTTVTCERPDGTEFDISITVTAAGDRAGMPSCDAAESGSVPVQVGIKSGYAGAENDIGNWTLSSPKTQYPDCFDASGHFLYSSCRIRVWVNGVPCNEGVAGCADWQSLRQDDPSADVRCKMGPYDVGLPACRDLANQYRTGAGTLVYTDVNPSTGEAADPATVPQQQQGGDPQPTTGANPSTVPSTGSDADPDSASCFGSGWSWNPVSWVYVPVKCALKWAFVPSTNISGTVTGWKGEFDGKVPFAWFPSMSPPVPGLPSSGCPSWVAKVDVGDAQWSHELLCGSEWEQRLRGARPWLAAAMIALALSPFLRSLEYAVVPALKLSRGGDD